MDAKYIFFIFGYYGFVAVILKVFCYLIPCIVANLLISVAYFLAYFILAGTTFNFVKKKFLNDTIRSDGRAVLITGCDSGFGNLLAQRLDSKGFHVFASCLSLSSPGVADLEKNCSDRIKIFQLDVTKDYSIKSAVDFVQKNLGSLELWAIVNNAGVLKGFSVELTSVEEFMENMNVNTFGALRVTKEFLPFLKHSKGRIINQISLGGRCAMPHFTPYTVSKFAAVGLSECLRQEMKDWGIRVISVEPESFRTAMTHPDTIAKRMDSTLEALDDDIKSEYGEEYLEKFKTFTIRNLSLSSPNLHVVVDALETAVRSKYPDSVYTPCRDVGTSIAVSIYKLLPRIITNFSVYLVMWYLKFPKLRQK